MENLFSKNLTVKNKEWVLDNYNAEEYRELLIILAKDNKKITNNAVKLAISIKKSTEVVVFPVIYSRKNSEYAKHAGAWSWFMYTKSVEEIGCTDNVKDCLTGGTFIKSNFFNDVVGRTGELWFEKS